MERSRRGVSRGAKKDPRECLETEMILEGSALPERYLGVSRMKQETLGSCPHSQEF